MTQVLVTGAAGFTGTHLAHELIQAGMSVTGLCQCMPVCPVKYVDYVVCDLFNKDTLVHLVKKIQPTLVVHLAAVSFVAQNNSELIYRTNVIATRNLLEALAQLTKSPENILLASSANIYGNTSAEIIDETIQAAPENDYAVSKLAMEYMAALWMSKLPITIVRPFNYTGVGQAAHFLIPKLVSHFHQKAPVLELGNLDVIRDFSDVRQVVKIYRQLLSVNAAGKTVNVCSGRGYSLQEILSILEKLTQYMPEIRINPEFVRSNEVKCLIGNKAYLESIIGSTFGPSFEETVQWMLQKNGGE